MKTIEIQGLSLGGGQPRVCVPLTGENIPALLREAQLARDLPADLFQWRMEGFFGDPAAAASALRAELKRPLMLSPGEDGSPEHTASLLREGGFALAEIPLAWGEEAARRLAKAAREAGTVPVVSRYYRENCPSRQTVGEEFRRLRTLGAELPWIGAAPRNAEELLALLGATADAARALGPVAAIGLGPWGRLAGVAAALLGSCLVLGGGEEAGDPGLLHAEDLQAILEDLSPKEGESIE